MRNRVRITITFAALTVLQPVAHQFRIKSSLDFHYVAIPNFQGHLVTHITAVGQDDDIARRQYDLPAGAAFVGKRVDVARAPMIEMTLFIRIAPLGHHGILTTFVAEIRSRLARHPNFARAPVNALGMFECLL